MPVTILMAMVIREIADAEPDLSGLIDEVLKGDEVVLAKEVKPEPG